MLSDSEINRYSRHIILPEIGIEGQKQLKQAKVLVIGAGGLGCPVLMYLVAAGIGNIGIVDFDKVDESNLHRQVLYFVNDIGKYKVDAAIEKLSKQNPFVNLKSYTCSLAVKNALEIIDKYNVVVDCSDNFATRYLVNDACVLLGKPLVAASIFRFEGQLSVYNYKNGPSYRCLFPEPPTSSLTCSEIGVIGVLPGILGTLQANEVIKIITGIGEIATGRLLLIDALTLTFSELVFEKNYENFSFELLNDYEQPQCEALKDKSSIKEISPRELQVKMNASEPIVIIDVREPFEYDICNIAGILIPLNELPKNIQKIPKEQDVVVMCHHGMRSKMAIKFLQENGNYKKLYNLSGGIHAYSNDIDNGLQQY